MAVSAENLIISIVRESTIGVTPATPAFANLSIVSESLVAGATFTESQMITGGTRGVPDSVLTQLSTSGDVSRELIFEAQTDGLLEALLGNTFGNDPHTNGTGADDLYDFTVILPATIEKAWDVDGDGTPDNYHRFEGQVPTSGSISFAPGEIISHTTSYVGLNIALDTSIITGATYTAPSGNSPMTSPRVTSMTLTTAGTETPVGWMTDSCFTAMNLNFENNTRALACIGAVSSKEIALGRINVSGTGSIYYAVDDPIQSMLDETEYGLVIDAEDTAGNGYKFYFPRVKFTSTAVNATGQSTDVMTEFTLQGLQDPTTKYTTRITRTAI